MKTKITKYFFILNVMIYFQVNIKISIINIKF